MVEGSRVLNVVCSVEGIVWTVVVNVKSFNWTALQSWLI